jgi:hypothetical protein
VRPAAPVAIGGVGGSGTRLVAALAIALGVRPGRDLNGPNDNLWFTLLFKSADVPDLAPADFAARAAIFVAAMDGSRALDADERALVERLAADDRPQHPRDWLQGRARSLLSATRAPQPLSPRWGWKEPNTHVVLPQWRVVRPDLRYVHVVRNGLDMALSANQNQRALWGPRLLGRAVHDSPRDALAYWVAAHRRIAGIGAALGDDFLWLDYDRLCRDPDAGLAELADFLAVPRADALALRDRVETPASTGRGGDVSLELFDPADLAYLRGIGHLA